MNTNTDIEFSQAMDALEEQLETPVIPGETAAWVGRMARLARSAGEATNKESPNHEELLAAIGEEDPELLSRVEQLREVDVNIRARWDQFARLAQSLFELTHDAEWEEGKFDSHVDDLKREGFSLIVDSRSQEKALTTWYLEAMNRDRGDVD